MQCGIVTPRHYTRRTIVTIVMCYKGGNAVSKYVALDDTKRGALQAKSASKTAGAKKGLK
jgi:hypothetical protein